MNIESNITAEEALLHLLDALEAAARRHEMATQLWAASEKADRRRFSDVPELITALMPFGVR